MHEAHEAHLGDPRRTRRLAYPLSDLGVRPRDGLPAACATPAATKAAYRFVASGAIAAADILGPHTAVTGGAGRRGGDPGAARHHHARCHRACRAHRDRPLGAPRPDRAAGPFGAGRQRGGGPLGLLHQHVWARDPEAVGQRPTAQQESQRWLSERYHCVLKSGCRVEALQLRTAARVERALALYAIAVWRLLWLPYLARAVPETPCTLVLSPDAWQVLFRTRHPTVDLPPRPPPLGQAVRWVARLGGFLDRAGGGRRGG